MLGRLELSVDECIEKYISMSDRIFIKKRHRMKLNTDIQGRFDTDELEKSIKKIIKDTSLPEDTKMRSPQQIQGGKKFCKVYGSSMSLPRGISGSTNTNDVVSSVHCLGKRVTKYDLPTTPETLKQIQISTTAPKSGRSVGQHLLRLLSLNPSRLGQTIRSSLMALLAQTTQFVSYGKKQENCGILGPWSPSSSA